jgi:hypothetical protein
MGLPMSISDFLSKESKEDRDRNERNRKTTQDLACTSLNASSISDQKSVAFKETKPKCARLRS